ncbi:MAG: ABC transporter substrate-binding protein, partial [Myxococcota bacterium]
ILGAFDQYLGGRPHIETLAFKVVKDDNTRLLALLGGSANLVQNAVAPLMLPVVQDQERLEVRTSESFKYTYLAFNLRKKALQDVRVRRAIAHGIDREAIVRHKFRGYATLSTGMLAPGHWAYHADVPTYGYDPELAMRLLDEAGYTDPDGPEGPKPRLTLELKVSSNKFRRALAMLMAHQLARVGIELRVRAYEWGTYFHDIKSGNFELTSLQWPSVLEPSLLRWAFHSENIPTPERRSAGANRGAYKNPELDELLDRGMSEADATKRRVVYAEVQRILARDLPYVSLWHEHNIAVLERGTSEYYTTPNARFESLKLAKPTGAP